MDSDGSGLENATVSCKQGDKFPGYIKADESLHQLPAFQETLSKEFVPPLSGKTSYNRAPCKR
jgi:hypothetical protein